MIRPGNSSALRCAADSILIVQDGQNSLRALGHEYAAVGQPLRQVAHRRNRRCQRTMVLTLMGARPTVEHGEHPGKDQDHRGPAPSPHQRHDDHSRCKAAESCHQRGRDIAR